MQKLILAVFLALFSTISAAASFLVGTGKADSTPGFVDVKTMGYGAPIPTTFGLHTRLHVRAVSIEPLVETADSSPLHIALVDTCFVTQKLKIEAVKELQRRFGDRFTLANTVIAATHTHNAPAGTSSYGHYQLSSGGFVPEVFKAQLAAVVEAFAASQAAKVPGDLSFAESELVGVSRNRSRLAFLRNPSDERALFPREVSTAALAIFANDEAGREMAAMHLFPVHATTSDKDNLYINADNKGLAALLDERAQRAERTPGAVTMFLNGGAGDASPNVLGDLDGNGDWDCALVDTVCTRWSADRHIANLDGMRVAPARQPLVGAIQIVHGYFDMSQQRVDGGTTCPAAFGLSMLAGSLEDGRGTTLTTEGVSCSRPSLLVRTLCAMTRYDCHGEKPVMLPTGYRGDMRTPQHLPLQIIRVGSLALVTVPSEVTTVATLRIRQAVLDELASSGVEHVHLIGYANAYAAYVATPEEYDAQHYEGASTLFGRNTLNGYIKVLRQLSRDLRDGTTLALGVDVAKLAPYLSPGDVKHLTIARSVAPRGASFGDVATAPRGVYAPGQSVSFSYYAPNPNLFPLRNSSYVEVQRQVAGAWQTVFTDDDPETKISWEQKPSGRIKVSWAVPVDAELAQYRILYRSLRSATTSQMLERSVGFELR